MLSPADTPADALKHESIGNTGIFTERGSGDRWFESSHFDH